MNLPGVVIDRRYTRHNTGAGHPESHRRIEILLDMLEKEPSGSWKPIAPRFATEEELALAHTQSHIRFVGTTAKLESTYLDGDTPVCSESYSIARLSAGGLLSALDELISSPMESAFALTRPPGHHAEANQAMGFCLFNNIAIAARYLQQKHGLERILIFDWDLHHGNGTQNIFEADPEVLYFSTHQYPFYPGSGHYAEVGTGKGKGYTVNMPLPPGMGNEEYETVLREVLFPIACSYKPQMILVSAGFDTYFRDPLGGMKLTKDGYVRLTEILRDVARQNEGCKLFLALEGGYDLEGLSECVQAILAFLGGRRKPPTPANGTLCRAKTDMSPLLDKIRSVQKEHWPCIG